MFRDPEALSSTQYFCRLTTRPAVPSRWSCPAHPARESASILPPLQGQSLSIEAAAQGTLYRVAWRLSPGRTMTEYPGPIVLPRRAISSKTFMEKVPATPRRGRGSLALVLVEEHGKHDKHDELFFSAG